MKMRIIPAKGFANQAELLEASTGVALGSTGIQEEWKRCWHHDSKCHSALNKQCCLRAALVAVLVQSSFSFWACAEWPREKCSTVI